MHPSTESPGAAQVVEADWTWIGSRLEAGVQVEIGGDGRILRCGRGLAPAPALRLRRRALLPGMVNAHSHGFQRGLRGLGERFDSGAGSFWTWRETMYGLAAGLDGARFRELTRRAFREMRSCGVTAVGEFHYLRHGPGGGENFAFDPLVLEAAADAGVRLVLLAAYYRTGGVDRAPEGAQRRFLTASPEAYWRQMDSLRERLRSPLQTLGAVAHSLRAATPEEVAELHREARRRGLVFHLHLEEQEREIEEVRARYGAGPMALVLERLAVDGSLTAVHCTHTAATELASFVERGGRVCLCPLTEANLGDGIAGLAGVPGIERALCLGTDCNARISLTEEMRWLEYAQRLEQRRRGVLRGAEGDVAATVFAAATGGGARSLGLAAGSIRPGLWADLIALDLDHPALAGAAPETLLAAFVFGGADGAVAASCVGGRWAGEGADAR